MSNPYLHYDVNNIIDAFCGKHGLHEETTKDANGNQTTKQVPYTYDEAHPVESMINNIAQLTNYSNVDDKLHLAIASEWLQKNKDEARAAIESLYSYGTSASSKRGSIDTKYLTGIEFKNTFTTIASAKGFGSIAKTLFADCVPCEERILDLLSLNPIKDVWDLIDGMYDQQVSFLLNLFDLLLGDKSVEALGDFCSLFNFLNFMCLPDFARMIIVLSSLITKYTFKLKNIRITLANIISQMFGFALTPLIALIDRYMQLILAPIECVITAMNAELRKMDVVAQWQTATKSKEKRKEIPKINEKDFSKALRTPVERLKKKLEAGEAEVQETLDKLKKSIIEALGLEDVSGKNLIDISAAIAETSRFIGLIQAIILTIQKGQLDCGQGNVVEKEQLTALLDTHKKMDTDLDIREKDGVITIAPKTPDDIATLLDVLGTIKGKQRKDKDDQSQKSRAITVAKVSVPVNNCLRSSPDATLVDARAFVDAL